jgi:hypothetical protein
MRKIGWFLLLMVCIALNLFAQAPSFEKTYGGSGNDYIYGFAKTSDHGYVLTGYTTSGTSGDQDVCLVKTDSLGNLQWAKSFGDAGTDYSSEVLALTNGYILFGLSQTDVSLGNAGNDNLVVRADLNGNVLWKKTFGGSNNDNLHHAIRTQDGGYIAQGNTSTFDFGMDDMSLMKIDSTGAIQWYKTYGTLYNNDQGAEILENTDGSFLIVGMTHVGSQDHDIVVVKTDSVGNTLWSKRYPYYYNEEAMGIVNAANGDYLIIADSNPYGGTTSNIVLLRIDNTGNVKWVKRYASSDSQQPQLYGVNLLALSDGNILLEGQWGKASMTNTSGFLIKTDSAGTVLWSRTYGGSTTAFGASLYQTEDRGFIIAGGTTNLGSKKGFDCLLLKTNEDGTANSTGTVSLSTMSLSITPVDAGFSTTSHTLTVQDGQFLHNGNVFAQSPLRDTTKIISFTPKANANNVARAAAITVTFDKSIDSQLLSDSSCVIVGSLSGPHSSTFQYDASTFTATITPKTNFKSGDVVWVTLTGALRDSLQSFYSWAFTAKTDSSSGVFKTTSSISVGNQPFMSIAVDIDNDGYSDIVSVNNADGTISILKNNKNGTFSKSSTIYVGGYPGAATAIDADGDGYMDLAVAVSGQNKVAILKNDGTGAFSLSSIIAVGSVPWDIIAADINGDGKTDLVVPNTSSNTVSILINQGDGTFRVGSTVGVGNSPMKITAADINGDGYVDLISANNHSNDITILTNNGVGTFVLDTTISVGVNPNSTVAANFFGNGQMDLAVANWASSTVSILKNNGNGHFVLSSTINVPAGPCIIAATDIDGDGNIDLISGSSSDDTIAIYKNDGHGAFHSLSPLTIVGVARAVVPVDVDNNGAIDLVVTNNSSASSISSNNNNVLILKNNQVYESLPPDTTKAFLVMDVPNDNGKHVFVRWKTAGSALNLGMKEFDLYRYDQNAWTYIQGNIPALKDSVYQVIARTLYDSTINNGMHWSKFQVIAHTAIDSIYTILGPDSGYSVDNLPPQVPSYGSIGQSNGYLTLHWHAAVDTNGGFNGYNIYRATSPAFTPSTSNKIACVVDTAYIDYTTQSNSYYYKVASVDSSGNESPALTISTTTGISSNTPLSYNLSQNYPNPFNPTTKITFSLLKDGFTTLAVYNVLGQKVATLLEQQIPAGEQTVVFNASQLSSGVYFYKLQSGSYLQIRKMILMK